MASFCRTDPSILCLPQTLNNSCCSSAISYNSRAPSVAWRRTLFILLTIAGSRPLVAQDRLLPVIHFNRLTTADGLRSNQIRSNVVRDRQGFIWVSTENGLTRYDWYTCKVYRELSNFILGLEGFG
jgi:hypothetical protein